MRLGRVCEVRSFREWVVSVQRGEEEARRVRLGSFVELESGLVGAVVDAEQAVPEQYVGRDIEGEGAAESLFPGNIVDRSRYVLLGLGGPEGFSVERQPGLRESARLMEDEEVREFHRPDGDFSMEYVGDLIDYSLAGPEAVVAMLERVEEVEKGRGKLLKSLKDYAKRVAESDR